MRTSSLILILLAGILLAGCGKQQTLSFADLTLATAFTADGQALQWDTIRYQNEAGNVYSVHNLEFYLSDFVFISAEGDRISHPQIVYCNARTGAGNTLSFSALPAGNYKGLECRVGIVPEWNISNSLPANLENVNMAWPESMGGGYHYMKLEGYTQTPGGTQGYAVHLGGPKALVSCSVQQPFSVDTKGSRYTLQMNLNEWYRNPQVYNFQTDGNYTMNDTSLMKKIAANGRDVFFLLP